VGKEIDAVHDLANAQDAHDAGVLAVADAHDLLELFGGGDFGQADGDAGNAEPASSGFFEHD